MTTPRTPRIALHWKILFGLTLGVVLGLILKEFNQQLWSAAPGGSFLEGLFNFLIQLTWLIGELFTCEQPFACPHGRPIVMVLSDGDLERRFGRR